MALDGISPQPVCRRIVSNHRRKKEKSLPSTLGWVDRTLSNGSRRLPNGSRRIYVSINNSSTQSGLVNWLPPNGRQGSSDCTHGIRKTRCNHRNKEIIIIFLFFYPFVTIQKDTSYTWLARWAHMFFKLRNGSFYNAGPVIILNILDGPNLLSLHLSDFLTFSVTVWSEGSSLRDDC